MRHRIVRVNSIVRVLCAGQAGSSVRGPAARAGSITRPPGIAPRPHPHTRPRIDPPAPALERVRRARPTGHTRPTHTREKLYRPARTPAQHTPARTTPARICHTGGQPVTARTHSPATHSRAPVLIRPPAQHTHQPRHRHTYSRPIHQPTRPA